MNKSGIAWHFNRNYLELISLVQLPNSSGNYLCKNYLMFYLFFFSFFHPTIPFSEQTARFLRGAQCEMTGNEIRTTPQPSHCSSGEFGNDIRQRFILLNQTLIPDVVSPVTPESFETQCFTIPWKPKHFPLVRIIYREGREFVWLFRFNTGRTEHQLLFRCSGRSGNLSSVNKVIWRTIYLLKMCMLLWYKSATGTVLC